jgi:hypothetical protein
MFNPQSVVSVQILPRDKKKLTSACIAMKTIAPTASDTILFSTSKKLKTLLFNYNDAELLINFVANVNRKN